MTLMLIICDDELAGREDSFHGARKDRGREMLRTAEGRPE